MSDYRVADGSDVVLGSLNVLSPQPTSTGVQATERTYAADGTFTEQGLYVELLWAVVPNKTTLQAILTSFGVLNADTNDVTVYVPSPVGSYTRYNGKAVRPQMGQDVRHRNIFYRDLVILVKDLAVSS